MTGSVATTLRRVPRAPYDLVFLDPPYPLTAPTTVESDLTRCVDHDWLVPGALVVVERSSRSTAPAFPEGFSDVRERHYGETTLWYGHAASSRDAATAAD